MSAPKTFDDQFPKTEPITQGSALVPMTLLIVGPSGAGKTGITNSLKSYQKDPKGLKAGMSPTFVSSAMISMAPPFLLPYKTTKKIDNVDTPFSCDYSMNIYDTRGISDSEIRFQDFIPDWNKQIIDQMKEVHFVLFVIPMDRLSKPMMEELNQMVDFLSKFGMKDKNIIVMLNKTDFFKATVVKGYAEALEVHLPEALKSTESRPLLKTCFLNPAEMEGLIAQAATSVMTDSTNRLVQRLFEKEVQPFQIRAGLLEAVKAVEKQAEEDRQQAAAAAAASAPKKKDCIIQ